MFLSSMFQWPSVMAFIFSAKDNQGKSFIKMEVLD